MDLFTEYEKQQEAAFKQQELDRIKRAMQWCRAYFNRMQKLNNDPLYPCYWCTLNMMLAWGKFDGIMERALNELCYSGFLAYHEKFNFYDGRRSFSHSQVYMITKTIS